MRSPRPPSDWPLQLEDDERTGEWSRTTFFGQPIPPLSATASLDALLGSPQSTVRERRPVEAATTEVMEVRRAV